MQEMRLGHILQRILKICRRVAVCGGMAALFCTIAGASMADDGWMTAGAIELRAGSRQEIVLPSPTLAVGAGIAVLDNRPADVIYYNQTDSKYANAPYGTDTIGRCGCGPTAMAMVVSTLSGAMVDPIQMSQWAYENGYWYKNRGSLHTLIPDAAKAWGLKVSGCTAKEADRLKAALNQQKLVVAIMGKGHFTNSGHFIVLRGMDKEGKVLIADPASLERSSKAWDLKLILDEASENAWEAGGPFWIIG